MSVDPGLELFKDLVVKYKDDYCKLVYVIFPYGEKGHPLEFKKPYDWQMRQWAEMTRHFADPEKADAVWRKAISTGNGSGKTAWAAQTVIMLMYTYMLRGRLTGNTKPQLTQVVWPEYDKWFTYARYSNLFFDKFGESIKSKDEKKADQWQFSMFTWDEANPAAVSGLHNEGNATIYVMEEAPGIPAVIFQYANGAFTDKNTRKVHLALGNSDDPDSKFEAMMSDEDWNPVRIDTRTLPHVSKDFIAQVLKECGGDEDADDFRVRVRGLPRKTNADSIINRDRVRDAFDRASEFDVRSVSRLPCIITVDPAWTGGDYTTIWVHQGHWSKLLNVYKLDGKIGEDHKITYDLVVGYEKQYRADAVWIDQGEGTALKTLANQDQRYHWDLVSFANSPTDTPDRSQSEYANMRAQLYFEARKFFNEGLGVLEVSDKISFAGMTIGGMQVHNADDMKEAIIKQIGYTKGDRHKITMKKLAESKKEIKARVGESPDLADGLVLRFARQLMDRNPENEDQEQLMDGRMLGEKAREIYKGTFGSRAYEMPESVPDYSMGAMYGRYDR